MNTAKMDAESRIAKLLNEAKGCGFDDPGLSDVLTDYFCSNDDSDCGKFQLRKN